MSEGSTAKERIAYFDNMKGFLIFCVVFGHLVQYLPGSDSHLLTSINAVVYMFHMPLFIIISGIFASKSYSREKGFRGENVLFYISLCLIFCLLSFAIDCYFSDSASFNFFRQKSAPWYLWCMAAFTLFTPVFGRLKPAVVFPIIIAAAVFSGFWISDDYIPMFASSRFFVYLPVFAAGYYIGIDGAKKIHDKIFSCKLIVLLRILALLIFIGIFVAAYFVPDSYPSMLRRLSTGANTFETLSEALGGSQLLFVAGRLGFYVWTAIFAFLMLLFIPQKRSLITIWGERSLQVYIVHMLILYMISYVDLEALFPMMTDWWVVATFILAYVLTTALAAPKFLQTWTNALKSLCKKAVREQEDSAAQ